MSTHSVLNQLAILDIAVSCQNPRVMKLLLTDPSQKGPRPVRDVAWVAQAVTDDDSDLQGRGLPELCVPQKLHPAFQNRHLVDRPVPIHPGRISAPCDTPAARALLQPLLDDQQVYWSGRPALCQTEWLPGGDVLEFIQPSDS